MKTTQQMLNRLGQTLGDGFKKQLDNMPFKDHVRDAMVDGFRMGVHEGIKHTVKMLEVEVVE